MGERMGMDLGPLPEADASATREELSTRAFQAVLPAEMFRFRGEGKPDAGVDGWLELLVGGRYANFRAQVQLKSRAMTELNSDGSVTYEVEVSNLNYLCNGPSPLYVLYLADSGELRYAWAHAERRRLEEAKPGWMGQKTVTLRFRDVLTPEAVSEIHSRILQAGRLDRQIQEVLARADTGERVVLGIDAETLESSDPDRLAKLLLEGGTALVTAGCAAQVLEAATLLKSSARTASRVRLTCAYANYVLGRYHGALSDLADAGQARDLSPDDRELIGFLRRAIDYQTGRIDHQEYLRRQQEWLQNASGPLALTVRLETCRHAIPAEPDEGRRRELVTELRAVVSEVQASSTTAAFKLQARLFLLHGEACDSILSFSHLMGLMKARRAMGRPADPSELREMMRERWPRWDAEALKALQEAAAMEHPLLVADALFTKAHVLLARLANAYVPLLMERVRMPIPEQVADVPLHYARQSARFYAGAGSREGEVRARMLEAEILELVGKRDEAQSIARDVLPTAEMMEYGRHRAHAEGHLTGSTGLARLLSATEEFQSADDDFSLAELPDPDILRLARHTLEALRLPEHRLPVIEREWESLRDIARERVGWCRHLELIQDLSHGRSPTTHYLVDPERSCECEKIGTRSRIGNPDWRVVIRTFKETYCEGCRYRDPKRTGAKTTAPG